MGVKWENKARARRTTVKRSLWYQYSYVALGGGLLCLHTYMYIHLPNYTYVRGNTYA